MLTEQRAVAEYFEHCCDATQGDARSTANWVTGEVFAALNRDETEFGDIPLPASSLAKLILRINDGTISHKIGKQVFEAMWAGEGEVDEVIEAKGLKQVTDSGEIEALIDDVLNKNPGQIEQYKAGKSKVFGFFVGQVMKNSKGKANPQQVNELLKAKLD